MFSLAFPTQPELKLAACHYTFRFLPALRVVSWPAAKKSLSEVDAVTLIVIIIVVFKVSIIINITFSRSSKNFQHCILNCMKKFFLFVLLYLFVFGIPGILESILLSI